MEEDRSRPVPSAAAGGAGLDIGARLLKWPPGSFYSMIDLEGVGHEFWADAGAGFGRDDQEALILFLLTFPGDSSTPTPSHR